jgi:hypothetical protein
VVVRILGPEAFTPRGPLWTLRIPQSHGVADKENQNMKTLPAALVILALIAPVSNVHSQSAVHSFSFGPANISGFPSGAVTVTGGGTYELGSGLQHPGGGFRCTQDINQGPLATCKAGEGVRWDSREILASTPFRCSASETPTTIFTNDNTVVMQADFYRAGDGVNESFTAAMIVSAVDLDPSQPGIQNVWIQGVGCAEASVNFR